MCFVALTAYGGVGQITDSKSAYDCGLVAEPAGERFCRGESTMYMLRVHVARTCTSTYMYAIVNLAVDVVTIVYVLL